MAGIRTRNRRHEPRKRPVQQRSRDTVAAIIEAAAQVFETQGYTATTTDAVAERAGVSIGTLYQYYPDKDVLLVALFERHLDEIEGQFAQAIALLEAAEPLPAVVAELVRRTFALHSASPQLHRILVEEAPLPAALLERYTVLERRLRGALVEYLTDSVADPGLVALMTMNVLETTAHRFTVYPPAEHSESELQAATVAMLVAYVGAQR